MLRKVRWKWLYWLYRVFCPGITIGPGKHVVKTRRALWGTEGLSNARYKELYKP